jgi:hypothetical protein
MSSTDILYVNDRDLSDFGVQITDVQGVWDGLTWRRGSSDMPGHAGSWPHELASLDPRVITVTVQLEVASIAAREAALNSLDAHLMGMLELRFADQPNKVIDAILEDGPTEPEARSSFVDSTADLFRTLTFRMHQPVKKDRYARVVGFGATRQEIQVGTMPSTGTMLIMGAATNPVIRYRASNGALVGQLAFTVTLAASDYLRINLRDGRITQVASGVESSGASLLNTGSSYFRLDPGDGDFDNSAWPTLETTAGNGVLNYRREWAS